MKENMKYILFWASWFILIESTEEYKLVNGGKLEWLVRLD